ncbi:hypothetical protein THASP1DRAFT_9234, partial [Thamnocephalis sphaerospora]
YVSDVTDPWTNLAVEEWLFRHGDPDTYVLLLYRNRPCVVIGRNQNPWHECNLPAMKKAGVALVRRQSGGGTVYHDIGNSNYCVMMPREAFTRRANVEMMARALHQLDIPAAVNERHDLVVDQRKISLIDAARLALCPSPCFRHVSGSAFKLVAKRAYHHGTMLIDTDLVGLGQYLHSEKTGLVTKGVASVRSPVTNLRAYSYTVDHLSFCEAVRAEFLRAYAGERGAVHDVGGAKCARDIAQPSPKCRCHHQRTWDWIYGQTPEFTHTITRTFSWATV